MLLTYVFPDLFVWKNSLQLKEAALIVNHPGISMNDKKEWVRPAHIGVRGEAI